MKVSRAHSFSSAGVQTSKPSQVVPLTQVSKLSNVQRPDPDPNVTHPSGLQVWFRVTLPSSSSTIDDGGAVTVRDMGVSATTGQPLWLDADHGICSPHALPLRIIRNNATWMHGNSERV